MIDSKLLLNDLRALLPKIEADLLKRCKENQAVDLPVLTEYEAAKAAGRTALAYEVWRGEFITQSAAAWVLATVFVRFVEDNQLLDGRSNAQRAWISGATIERLQIARETYQEFYRQNPTSSDREYLQFVFRAVCNPTGAKPIKVLEGLFDEKHNPLWRLGVSGDAALLMLEFWQKQNADTGAIVHDFRDDKMNTRFLGDLYQDLSEAARKKYALLQTPIFVEEFILDRTLTPAIREFGIDDATIIDPTCGSGHFVLGAFERIFDYHQRSKPALEPRELTRRALAQVFGVDLNPFAVAIARFRLLIAALKTSEVKNLNDAPDFEFNLATGDSLLHGRRFGETRAIAQRLPGQADELQHFYESEDKPQLDRILGRQYAAVVGNPPYITVKDAALNSAYRDRFGSCHMKYSLAAPFLERFFDLAVRKKSGESGESGVESQSNSSFDSRLSTLQTLDSPTGFVGCITANSFMKREFGKKLIETFIPRWDVTHVIDTSGAYIPGHGTPTVILFGRHQSPAQPTIRTVMGIKGEPATPPDAAKGKVWTSIVDNLDRSGAATEYVSISDTARQSFHRHPWSIGGGGAAELKELIDEQAAQKLEDVIETICGIAYTRLDDAYFVGKDTIKRVGIKPEHEIETIIGEFVRDWDLNNSIGTIFPYDENIKPLDLKNDAALHRFLWLFKEDLWRRRELNGDHRQLNRTWYEWNRFLTHRFNSKSITFAFVATHNHFVFDEGKRAFNRHAPLIKLPKEATVDEHFKLLGLLNSSIACFWMKQIFHNKGSSVDDKGARQTTVAFENFYEFDSTKIQKFPLAKEKPLELARELDALAQELSRNLPGALIKSEPRTAASESNASESTATQNPDATASGSDNSPSPAVWAAAKTRAGQIREQMIFLQEELDWKCYVSYQLAVISHQQDKKLLTDDCSRSKIGHSQQQIEHSGSKIEHSQRQIEHSGSKIEHSQRQNEHSRAENDYLHAQTDHLHAQIEHSQPKIEHSHAKIEHSQPANQPEQAANEHLRLKLGERAFEIVLARKMAAGELQTTWFERHNSTPITELPAHWSREYKQTVENRIALIESDANIRLIEQPEYKRRWNFQSWDAAATNALREWLLNRLEDSRYWQKIELTSAARLADLVRNDAEFLGVAEMYRGRKDFDLANLVAELVKAEAVPLAPVLRYKETGLDKRRLWERTWEAQRREDELEKQLRQEYQKQIDAGDGLFEMRDFEPKIRERIAETIGKIDVPPKYQSKDFRDTNFWRLRGKLDVPKERFTSFPAAARDTDKSLVIAWAGWNHLELAQAVANYYTEARERQGWSNERLIPLLHDLTELLPWLLQWHNEFDPTFGERPGDFFKSFIEEEARAFGLTVNRIKEWKP